MVLVENTGRVKLKLRFRVSLMPGLNEVDCDAWSLCRNDPITSHYLGVGRVKVHGISEAKKQQELPFCAEKEEPTAKPAVVEKPKQESVSASESVIPRGGNDKDYQHSVPMGMSAVDARAFIKACRRPDVLERMLEFEGRSSVKTAIEKRLQQLE